MGKNSQTPPHRTWQKKKILQGEILRKEEMEKFHRTQRIASNGIVYAALDDVPIDGPSNQGAYLLCPSLIPPLLNHAMV